MSEGLIGRTLLHGEYRLTGILGRGGMATVYRAHSLSLDTDVAVKILAPRLAADPGFRERHHDEARSLAQLHHPNLVEVHHYGEEDDLVYIVLRLVPGGTLKNRLAAVGGALDLLTTARLISQVADALQLAHDRGLVHLDIKPANILLGRSDWPLLADFGITRAVKNVQSSHGTQRMAGTPLYMSPEQCRCGPVDGRSDQYSLASTAFELLTGRQPFHAETTEALLQHQIEDPPPRPREMNPGIPAPVEDVLLRALAKSPDDRYPSMRDFAAAFTDAAERTRAVSLETKAAVSGIAPNLLAVVALLLLGPLLVSLLPGGASLGTHLPLSWPFQLVVSILVAGLLLGMRWHLIGLLTRLLNSLFDTVLGRSSDVAGPGAQPPGPLAVKAWRNAIVGSVEGLLNLAYLLVVYRLIAVPALAAAGVFLDPAVDRFVATAVAIVVVVLALGIVVAIYRGGGPVVAGLTLGVCWAFANALPTADVATAGGLSLAWTVKAIVGVGVLVILLATRHPTQTLLRRLASGSLGPLVAELHAGATPEEVGLARRQIEGVIGAAIDFMYLVIGYALLRTPLTEGLQNLLGLAPAAILVSGVAALVWFLLTLRIRAIAGGAGLALAILLGAPLLVSLPFLESRILGATWPTTAAVWVVGTALVLTLAAVRGQVQRVGRQAFGPMIDRGLLGATPAPTEDHSQRRVGALGDVGGALLDVGYLVLAYWILGVPAAAAIGRTTGRAAVGSILLALLVLAVIAILLGPITRALLAVEETGGPPWSSRFRAVPAIAVALVALVIGGCAAAPLALAAPDVTGGIALQAPAASTVVVDWEHWLPWTPAHDQATYDISLSCPDGRSFGEFREAYRPGAAAPMPSGSVGHLGSTGVACENWPAVYFAERKAAGLPAQPSASLDWLDVQAIIHPDLTVDVIETHRVLFTYGSFRSLTWDLAPGGDAAKVSDLQILENGVPYALNPASLPDRYARTATQNGHVVLTWWFPTVASPDVRVYTLKYRLNGSVRPVASGLRFERQVLPVSRTGPAWRTTVEVKLPGSFDASVVHLSSTGAPSQLGLVGGQTASFNALDVANDAGLDVIVDFPKESLAAEGAGTAGSGGGSSPPTATATPTRDLAATAAANLTGTALARSQAVGPVNSATSTPTLAVSATSAASATSGATVTDTSTPNVTDTPTPDVTATSAGTTTPTTTATATGTSTALAEAAVTATATTGPKSCVSVPVLAMYYDWYDMSTWSSGTTSDQPVTPYVSADRTTIERQVAEAQSAGIDGFEVNWWGPGNQTDTNLQTLLSVAGSRGFKVTVDFDLNSPFVHSAADVTNDLKYLAKYYPDPSWFHFNGKPYVVFYGTRKYDVATWGTILRQADPNHGVTWIAEGDIFSYLNVFDGIHPYSIAWSPDPSSQLASYARQARAYPGKIWMATVMPGYNDKLVNGAQGFAVNRQNGAYYTTMWQGAMATHPDVLSITSFNEWVEGSMMEPSKTYGNLYLDLTKQMVTKYHGELSPCS